MGKPVNKRTTSREAEQLVETTLFEPDNQDTDSGKNSALATLLAAPWKTLAIVRVERIEIGDRGWRVVFRE